MLSGQMVVANAFNQSLVKSVNGGSFSPIRNCRNKSEWPPPPPAAARRPPERGDKSDNRAEAATSTASEVPNRNTANSYA